MKHFEKRFDYDGFSVTLTHASIVFIERLEHGDEISYPLMYNFENSIDPEEDGGKIEIKYKDSWGSEMIFIHYQPTSLKSLFEFIGRGYNIKLFKEK